MKFCLENCFHFTVKKYSRSEHNDLYDSLREDLLCYLFLLLETLTTFIARNTYSKIIEKLLVEDNCRLITLLKLQIYNIITIKAQIKYLKRIIIIFFIFNIII